MTERKEKFTPGPWERARNKSRGGSGKVRGLSISRVVDSNGDVVAFMYPRPSQVANLHLITAAPEMYHALQMLVGVIDDYNRGPEEGFIPRGIMDRYDRAIELCRAALQKARGELKEEAK